MESNFICCFCNKVPTNVVESECCHSLFCWTCVVNNTNDNNNNINGNNNNNNVNKKCPSCNNGEINPETCTESLAVKKIIEGMVIKCSNGCGEMVSVLDRAVHEEICPRGSTLCPNSELCGIIEKTNLINHLIVCNYRIISCHKCDLSLPLPQLQDHLDNTCGGVVVECPNLCSDTILRKNIGQHIAVCPNVELDCPFAEYGCTAKPTRANYEHHLAEGMFNHMSIMARTITDQQVQINALREQLVTTQEAVSQIPSGNQHHARHSNCNFNFDETLDFIGREFREMCHISRQNMTPFKAVVIFLVLALLSKIIMGRSLFFFVLRLVKWIIVGKLISKAIIKLRLVNLHQLNPPMIAAFILSAVMMPTVLSWIWHL